MSAQQSLDYEKNLLFSWHSVESTSFVHIYILTYKKNYLSFHLDRAALVLVSQQLRTARRGECQSPRLVHAFLAHGETSKACWADPNLPKHWRTDLKPQACGNFSISGIHNLVTFWQIFTEMPNSSSLCYQVFCPFFIKAASQQSCKTL